MQLQDLLLKEEGSRFFVYDDATGKPIIPGSQVIGHPTIGVGRALDTHGITDLEIRQLLDNDIKSVRAQLMQLGWFCNLDTVRQDCMVAMAFQLGVKGMLQFKLMIAAIIVRSYGEAAQCMLGSIWAKQTPARVQRMADMIRTGQYPA